MSNHGFFFSGVLRQLRKIEGSKGTFSIATCTIEDGGAQWGQYSITDFDGVLDGYANGDHVSFPVRPSVRRFGDSKEKSALSIVAVAVEKSAKKGGKTRPSDQPFD